MVESSHELCNAFLGELDVFIAQGINDNQRTAANLIIKSYRKWEPRLFAQGGKGAHQVSLS
jgi:hypothetical protein